MTHDNTQDRSEKQEEVQEESELKQLKKECEEYRAGWQRAQADYQNLQREVEKKRSEWVQMSEFQIIQEFLPAYDHLKKAIQETRNWKQETESEVKNFCVGIEMILKQFGDVLKRHGVEEMKTVGESFDPEQHEALSEEVSEDHDEGIILKEIESGYMLKDRVVRPAKVIVAKKAE